MFSRAVVLGGPRTANSDPSSSQKLEHVLRGVAGQPLVVIIQGHPDPDAIASAWAHKRICESLGVPVTIAHALTASHRENRALFKRLGVEMCQVASAADLTRFALLSGLRVRPKSACEVIPELSDGTRGGGRTQER